MKKGFKISMTFEAIDALLRSHQSIGEFPTRPVSLIVSSDIKANVKVIFPEEKE